MNKSPMRSAQAVTFLTTLAICSPTMAGWQYMEWGSTTQETLADTAHGVRATTPGEQQKNMNTFLGEALAVAPHIVGGEKATAFFHFKNDQLSAVVPKFPDIEQGFRARRLLREQYGIPDLSSDGGSGCRSQRDQWRLEEQGNNVSFDALECKGTTDAIVSITYAPIPKASETGL